MSAHSQATPTIVIDDLSGAELGDDVMTVTFALEGAAYEIDLATASAPPGEQSAARAWLLEHGVDVPSRERLSAELLERYRAR